MKTKLLLLSMLLLTSCAKFGDVVITPEGVYDVSVESLSSTNCPYDTPTIGDDVFVVSPADAKDETTSIEIGGLNGGCIAGNDVGYVSSYTHPCHFTDTQGYDIQIQFGLDFNLDGFTGDAETQMSGCIIKCGLTRKKR